MLKERKTQRERFEAYYALPGSKRIDEQRMVLAAADAYDASEAAGRILPEELARIVDAVADSRAGVWANGADLLALAMERWEAARREFIKLLNHSKAHVRFAALCSLKANLPRDLIDVSIRQGLGDKSAKVRWKAAGQASTLNCRHLLSDIDAAIRIEKSSKTLSSLQFDYLWLRDGYIRRDLPDGRVTLSIRLPTGGGGIVTATINEIESKGIEKIIADYLARFSGAAGK